MKSKPLLLLGVAAAGGLVLFAGSQTWVSFMLAGSHAAEAVTGHSINAALSPIAIAIVAAALTLTIAGKAFRRVLGGIVALLGVGAAVLAGSALASPLAAVGGRITELTGIAGGADANDVVWHQVSPWAWAVAGAGIGAALLGAVVAVVSGGWGMAGRKYEAAAAGQADRRGRDDTGADPSADRISDWDALSEGDDPSEDFR